MLAVTSTGVWLVVEIVCGVIVILEFVRRIALRLKWQLVEQAAETAAVKSLIDADVLGRFEHVDETLDTVTGQLAALRQAMKPNGKDTQEIGDIAARTEDKIDELTTKVGGLSTRVDDTNRKLDQHIGAADEKERQLRAALDRKADRPPDDGR